MTDRLKGVVVSFVHPIREDDAELLVRCIYQLRGVAAVTPVKDSFDDVINREQVKLELRQQILEVLK